MGVVNHLKKFLSEQPQREAAVPGLGVFYVGEKEGVSCILFKEVSPTDKAFLNYIAFEDNISEEDARTEMERWVRQILQDLKSSGNVYIDGVGSFAILSDRVEFVPVVNAPKPAEAEFGLENPQPGNQPYGQDKGQSGLRTEVDTAMRPDSVQEARQGQGAPVQGTPRNVRPNGPRPENRPDRGMRPSQEERRPGKNAFRPNDNRQRPSGPRPAAPSKGIVLENRRGGNGVNGGQGNHRGMPGKAPQPAGRNIFTQWWFLLCCLAVVVLIVLFAVRPVRESLFGDGQPAEMETLLPAADSLIEENVDMMLSEEGSDAMAALDEEAVSAENERIAQEVIAGQIQREKAEAKARQARSESQARPAAKPESRPVVKNFAPQAPEKGKYYIVVGSFSQKANARNMFYDLQEDGLTPSALYVEAKKLYYISVKTCTTRGDADKALAYFKERKMDCWAYRAR